jgi:hypothetical protein
MNANIENKLLAWHYTTARNMNQIQRDGVIKLEGQAGNYCVAGMTALIQRPIPHFAWFTTANKFPVSAIPAVASAGARYLRSLKLAAHAGGGLYRIGVDPCGLVQWIKHPWREKNKKTSVLRRFEQAAFPDNVKDWWVSDRPVPITNALIERIG